MAVLQRTRASCRTRSQRRAALPGDSAMHTDVIAGLHTLLSQKVTRWLHHA
jgi:hypothetical protein